MATRADVFIIESLDPDDEGNGRFEGGSISHVLRLHGKEPRYQYVRTLSQFTEAVSDFRDSKYRYLHISAHANSHAMYTTNQDQIDFKVFAKILSGSLRNRRLFLSACSMVNKNLAKLLIPSTGCYSIVGPTEDICFSTAVVFWPAVYHLMFSSNVDAMKRSVLKGHLQDVAKLFCVGIGYYSRNKNKSNKLYTDLMTK